MTKKNKHNGAKLGKINESVNVNYMIV